MSYWFPKLVETKVPTPTTIMVDMNEVDPNFVEGLRKIFWMKKPNDKQKQAFTKFRLVLEEMGRRIGYPFFLRTGQTSHKHEWSETCFIKNKAVLLKNAQAIGEYSIMADMKGGFPINVWAARKIIETAPAFEAFGGRMPITKEMRYFFEDRKIICSHPYWPEEALKDHVHDDKNWKLKLQGMNRLSDEDKQILKSLTVKVATKFEGYWSIDWLKGKDGVWYAIDMTTGDDSYHWKGCPNRKEKDMARRDKPKREKKKPKKKKKK